MTFISLSAKTYVCCATDLLKRNITERKNKMDSTGSDVTFELQLDSETAEKFSVILNDESLMHAGFVAHQSNNNVLTLALAEDVKKAA